MYKKKNLIQTLTLICAAAALLLSVLSLILSPSREDYKALAQQLLALQAQVDSLTAQLDGVAEESGLADWNLAAAPWADGTGADISLTALPVVCPEGTRLRFLVKLGGQEAASTDCVQTDAGFTATVSLPAADGYGYYCLLLSPDGGELEVPLTTPEMPRDENLVQLKSSLSAFGMLTVEDWEETEDGELIIRSGCVEVQFPLIGTDASSVRSAALVLLLDGEEVSRAPVNGLPEPTDGRSELTVRDIAFPIPEMASGSSLELQLEVTFPDGQVISSPAAVWYPGDEGLYVIVG